MSSKSATRQSYWDKRPYPSTMLCLCPARCYLGRAGCDCSYLITTAVDAAVGSCLRPSNTSKTHLAHPHTRACIVFPKANREAFTHIQHRRPTSQPPLRDISIHSAAPHHQHRALHVALSCFTFRFALIDMGRMNGDPMGDLMCNLTGDLTRRLAQIPWYPKRSAMSVRRGLSGRTW